MDWINSLEPLLKTFWFIAIPASFIFLLQTIMTLIGMDGSDGVEADFDGDFDHGSAPVQYFSFRNLINFLLGFSWTGILFFKDIPNKTLLVALATGIGLLFLFLFFFIMNQMKKLAEDNTVHIKDALGKNAEVYLSIPESKSGKGKILVSIHGSTREMDAITKGEKIETGNMVKVIAMENESLLIVEKI